MTAAGEQWYTTDYKINSLAAILQSMIVCLSGPGLSLVLWLPLVEYPRNIAIAPIPGLRSDQSSEILYWTPSFLRNSDEQFATFSQQMWDSVSDCNLRLSSSWSSDGFLIEWLEECITLKMYNKIHASLNHMYLLYLQKKIKQVIKVV